MLRTKDNTRFIDWFGHAHSFFLKQGLAAPGYRAAKDAYEVGETPETWAAYEMPHWNEQPWRHGKPDAS